MAHTAYECDEMGRLIEAIPARYQNTSAYREVTDSESVGYTYDSQNRLSTITTNSTTYTFIYDAFGNTTSVDAGNYELASYEYNENNGKLKKLTYSNGLVVEYLYNALENLSEVWYTVTDEDGNEQRTLAYEYEYTADGKLHSLRNNLNGRTEAYKYDVNGRLTEFRAYDNNDLEYTNSTDYYYNDQSRLSGEWQYFRYLAGADYVRNILYYSYTYNSQGNITEYRISNSASGTVEYEYDALNRLSGKDFTSGSFSNEVSYAYENSGNVTSPTRVNNYTSYVNGERSFYSDYGYDSKGNINYIYLGSGVEIRYTYDKLNQLTREDNGAVNLTYTYTYDKAGNIIKKETYPLVAPGSPLTSPTSTKTYTYGDSAWGDRLTAYNGTPIYYDSVGNPLTYYNGSSYEFTWRGRQLTSAKKSGTTTNFTYNDEGLRTSKSRDTYEVKYYYSNGLLVGESNNTETILYIYDAEGAPLGMQYRKHTDDEGAWTTLWYEKNLQGDIIAIYSPLGTKVMSFKYDAWGNFTSRTHTTDNYATAAKKSPFLYRGYYYDSDLGFYVTETRYYDPAIGRFISPDAYDVITATPTALTDKNLYAYCDNNPVMRVDHGGAFWDTLFDVVSLAASVVDVVMNPDDAWAWVGLVGDVVDLIPFVSGVGEATDLMRVAGKVDDVADAVDDVHDAAKTGWRVGDEITNLTKVGNTPTWSTVRQRYWKNEAFYHPDLYPNDLERLKKGLAPIGDDGFSIELHHPYGRGGDNYFIFEQVTRTDHRFIHYGWN